MPIPQEILAVERPRNTVVTVYGKNKDKYAVKQRKGCKYINGRRIPINGATIGHIIDGKYVPKINFELKQNPLTQASIDLKDWGAFVLADNLAHQLLNELQTVYSQNDALKIYCISILRVCRPGIKDYELKDAYDESFLSELYPGVGLSKNTVSDFLSSLGKSYSRIVKYMAIRSAAVEAGHHILVDGTLKSNDSKINTLSDFSRKAREKGTRDISILYAFDLESQEPVCLKCFPGNMPDSVSYRSFIEENGIKKGILVGDKGFPSSSVKEVIRDNKELHYMNPLKRDSKYIKRYGLYNFEGQLPGFENILYKKVKVENVEKWLYCFRDTQKAHSEEYSWLHKMQKSGNFENEKYKKDSISFGTIILESDCDMNPLVAYRAYSCRWEIELVMRYYKQACEFDETRVHTDYSVLGSEFCNFLASVITYRFLNKFDKAELLQRMNYKRIISILNRAKKICLDGNEWHLIQMNPSQIDVLKSLGLTENGN